MWAVSLSSSSIVEKSTWSIHAQCAGTGSFANQHWNIPFELRGLARPLFLLFVDRAACFLEDSSSSFNYNTTMQICISLGICSAAQWVICPFFKNSTKVIGLQFEIISYQLIKVIFGNFWPKICPFWSLDIVTFLIWPLLGIRTFPSGHTYISNYLPGHRLNPLGKY